MEPTEQENRSEVSRGEPRRAERSVELERGGAWAARRPRKVRRAGGGVPAEPRMPSTAPRRRPTTSGPTSAPGGGPEEVPFSFGHQDSWKQLPLLGQQLIGGLPRRAARLSSIDVL